MHLAQHHFQAQSRYFENAIHFALSSVFSGAYGFVSLELDEDALWNGTASLLSATGVMPDGLPFDLGDAEPLPPARNVAEFLGAGEEGQLLCLAVPVFKRRRANCEVGSEDGEDGRRYRFKEVELFDETTGEDQRPVPLGLKNLRLVAASELGEDLVAMPMARVQADGAGHFVYDPGFIPPCLSIGASVRLMATLRRLVEMMDAKAESLRQQRGGQGQLSELATHEVTTYWLVHALYSSLGTLRHHLEAKRAHPRALYQDLVRLAGALCTFSVDSRIEDIPLYDHEGLTEVFGALEAQIRQHLDVVIRQSYLSVPLARSGAHVFSARLADPRALDRSDWVLRVHSSAPSSSVIADVPRKVKICSAEDVMKLVADANPGLPVEHLSVPPSKVAPRVGSHYFRVRTEGKAWKVIQARSSVGVYVPDSLTDAEVELMVVIP